MKEKFAKRIERVFKGVANAKRAKMLEFIATENNTTLWKISQGLNIDFKNTAQHSERLVKAGLVEKHYVGRSVMHLLTPYGKKIYKFIKSFK